MTGAPETPACRSMAMASSTDVWGARVKRCGWDVIRSDTILFDDLEGVETKTRRSCCCASATEKEKHWPIV